MHAESEWSLHLCRLAVERSRTANLKDHSGCLCGWRDRVRWLNDSFPVRSVRAASLQNTGRLRSGWESARRRAARSCCPCRPGLASPSPVPGLRRGWLLVLQGRRPKVPPKRRRPRRKARSGPSRKRVRTDRKEPGRQAIRRSPSEARPAPGGDAVRVRVMDRAALSRQWDPAFSRSAGTAKRLGIRNWRIRDPSIRELRSRIRQRSVPT